MLDVLPEKEQELAYGMIKRILLAWDPDFTKLTDGEATALQAAETEISHGEVVTDDGTDCGAD